MAKFSEEKARRAVAIARAQMLASNYGATDDWQPHWYQIPPEDDDWFIWLLEGGRGAGKTATGAHYVLNYLRELGSKARVYVGAPTRDDARDVCAEGPSGLISIAPGEFDWHRSDRQAFHKGGGYVRFLGSEEPDRWNGPGFGLLWADELALWNKASWDMAQFCLRETSRPHCVVTTTPKRSKLIKDIKKRDDCRSVHATTYDNTALSKGYVGHLESTFGKDTRMARLEMLAEEPPEVEGATWKYDWIEEYRRPDAKPEDMQRIVVAIDPAGTAKKSSDMTGIAVAGLGWDGHYYIFDSQGDRWSPKTWASLAVHLYGQYRCDKLIGESNYGGEMVKTTIQTVWREGVPGYVFAGELPFEFVTATRGKTVRADPIASLYEQHLVHHVGIFTELEDQMCTFPIENDRDDLVDALVWALYYLSTPVQVQSLAMSRVRGW